MLQNNLAKNLIDYESILAEIFEWISLILQAAAEFLVLEWV